MIKVLFVCMGNICRSPTAHGVFETMVQAKGLDEVIEIDSAGTHAYHVGAGPDKRSIAAAKKRGYELSHLRARVIEPRDFVYFDHILVMDHENLENVSLICPEKHQSKVQLFLNYSPVYKNDPQVPDPYYSNDGFDEVLDRIESASIALLQELESQTKSST